MISDFCVLIVGFVIGPVGIELRTLNYNRIKREVKVGRLLF